ncbi:uncharacterized protein DUF4241 [Isoptericola jiangsuensis]|uniref:Uncharacterized protein DUF4241 n=1 Tax=Isoptericola jiangsuensis TaxID=548579 RepID=A0A2A9EX10_9MICO|nr:DUF4241 domain-containing protein [Isoptericola jiangsuensis]PFG43408.1 uncharacterized protein DUF4241 [Isoptericola jiangsuensis]
MTAPFLALRTGTPAGTPYALTVHDLGTLHVPSGRLEASDPYVNLGEGLVVPVPPGTYPVHVTVADVSREQDGSHRREAYLSVVLDDAARTAGSARPFVPAGEEPGTDGTVHGVPVDAGTVAFADATAAAAATTAVDDLYSEVYDHDGPDAWFARQDDADHLVEGCANVSLPGHGTANVVLAHSGWGDGFYAVVTTHDEAGALTGVHIDLGVVDDGPWWVESDAEDEDED